MNVRSAAARLSVHMSTRTEQAEGPVSDLAERRRRDARRRRLTVNGLRVLVGVVILGSWELTTRLGWVDVFFWSQPSAIAAKLWLWITQGTDLGPLWDQV
ncbi:MAG: sulfonate transport system permease protein, partial [Chloroflexota bacterium]|nr:sulfonate transport system permease protein [Chloroflexota bacterium]